MLPSLAAPSPTVAEQLSQRRSHSLKTSQPRGRVSQCAIAYISAVTTAHACIRRKLLGAYCYALFRHRLIEFIVGLVHVYGSQKAL